MSEEKRDRRSTRWWGGGEVDAAANECKVSVDDDGDEDEDEDEEEREELGDEEGEFEIEGYNAVQPRRRTSLQP